MPGEVWLDRTVFGFALLVTLLIGLVTGILPAWSVARQNLEDNLKEGGHRAGMSLHRARFRNGLIIGEIALFGGAADGSASPHCQSSRASVRRAGI